MSKSQSSKDREPKPRSMERGKRRGYACGRWEKPTYALKIVKGKAKAHRQVAFTMPGKMAGLCAMSFIPTLTGMILNGKR